MIIVTQKTARLARQYKLKPEELAFADLIAAGWDDADAYAVTIRTGATTWTKKALSEEYDRLASLEGVRRRIEDRKQEQDKQKLEQIKSSISADETELLKKATSKERMLITLQATLETLPPASPEWIKINQQIIDVSRMKQDEVKTDDDTIHYFLPVAYPTSCQDCLHSRCAECRYYKQANKEKGKTKKTE